MSRCLTLLFLLLIVFLTGCEVVEEDNQLTNIEKWQQAETRDPDVVLSYFSNIPDDWTAYTDDMCSRIDGTISLFAPGGEVESPYWYTHYARIADLICTPGTTGEIAMMSWWATDEINWMLEYDYVKADDSLNGCNGEWQTVEKTMSLGKGVCRDYSVATYMLLKSLGLDDIGIVGIGPLDGQGNGHAAAYVKIDDTVYALDYGLIYPLHQLQDAYDMPSVWFCATLDYVGPCNF